MCTQAWQEKEIKKLKGLFTDLVFTYYASTKAKL